MFKERREHLNKYDVIRINMQDFLSSTHTMTEMLAKLSKYLIYDLLEQYKQVRFCDETDLIQVMKDVFVYTKQPFIILIDEADLSRFAGGSRRRRGYPASFAGFLFYSTADVGRPE